METNIQLTNIKFEVNINEALRRYKSVNILETKKKIDNLKNLTQYSVTDIKDSTYIFLTELKYFGIISYDELDIIEEDKRRREEEDLKKLYDAHNWYLSLKDSEKEMINILIKVFSIKS